MHLTKRLDSLAINILKATYITAKASRVHQWCKNTLIFLPLLLSHQYREVQLLFSAVVAFFSLSLVCSSVYLINDIVDRTADRAHPIKKMRPIASGELSLGLAWSLTALLFFMGAILAYEIGAQFLGLILCYFCSALLYSLYFKKVVIIDVIILASFYILRIFLGGVATSIEISHWLLIFALFFFSGLAFIKRFGEIKNRSTGESLRRRGYMPQDQEIIGPLGISLSVLSVLVFCLYVSSEYVLSVYNRPELLWLLPPGLIFFNARMWLLANRGQLNEDPIILAFRERSFYILAIFTLSLLFLGKFL